MTAAWPPAGLPGLHVDFGEQGPSDRWRRPPTASYRCCCGFEAGARGPKRVATFIATVAAAHHAACRRRRSA